MSLRSVRLPSLVVVTSVVAYSCWRWQLRKDTLFSTKSYSLSNERRNKRQIMSVVMALRLVKEALAADRQDSPNDGALGTASTTLDAYQSAWDALGSEGCVVACCFSWAELRSTLSAPLSEFMAAWGSLMGAGRFHALNSVAAGAVAAAVCSALRALGQYHDTDVAVCQGTVAAARRLLHAATSELVPDPAESMPPTTIFRAATLLRCLQIHRSVATAISPCISDPLLPATICATSEDCVRHIRAYWRTIIAHFALPEYVANKWAASTKFMAGRQTSHAVVFLNMVLTKQLRELTVDEGRGARLLAAECVAAVTAEFSPVFKSIRCSEARTHQLRGDVLYFVRNMRALRRFYEDARHGLADEIEDCLISSLAAVAMRSHPCSSVVACLQAAGPSRTPAIPQEFVEHVWSPPPLTYQNLAHAHAGQLFHPASRVAISAFASGLAHEAFVKIELPSLECPLGSHKRLVDALAPRGESHHAAVSVVALRWELWDTYPPVSADELPAVEALKQSLKA